MSVKSSVFSDYITENETSQERIEKTINELEKKKAEHSKVIGTIITALKNTEHCSNNIIERMLDCGSFISIDKSTGRINGANFCKNKLCPICQWRKSLKVYGEIVQIQKVVEEKTKKFVFMTLTLENTKDLEDGINQILKGFYNFSNDRTFKKMSMGYIRTLEITYNHRKRTWHPHLHLIIATKKTYFEKDYQTQEQWANIWERCANVEYKPIIDIRMIKEENGEYSKAIAEVSKYAIKPFQTKEEKNQENTYNAIFKATHHRRLRSYGGEYSKAKKLLNFYDGETKEDKTKETDKTYRYNKGSYTEVMHEGGKWETVNNQESVNQNRRNL